MRLVLGVRMKWISVDERLPEVIKLDMAFKRTLSDWHMVKNEHKPVSKVVHKEEPPNYISKNC